MLRRLRLHVSARANVGWILAVALTPAAPQLRGETASVEEARLVAGNWVSYMVHQRGSWAEEEEPQVMRGEAIYERDTLVGFYFPVTPSGYIVVPILKELPPAKAYSEKHGLDPHRRMGFPALLREVLHHRVRLYIRTYGDVSATQPDTGEVVFGRSHRHEWSSFLRTPEQFRDALARGEFPPLAAAGPLLSTSWCQTAPYNDSCPIGDNNYLCKVGCVATAAAQIMKYWEWPPFGKGSHSYDWDGDNSCNGVAGGGELTAAFWDTYDWSNMPDSCDGGCTSVEKAALAELCYEVGVALEMDYGRCKSYALTTMADSVFRTYFRYDSLTIDVEYRDDTTSEGWFQIIQEEINAGRPMQYDIIGHCVVCDGWRDAGRSNQCHINYGTCDSTTNWYALDSLSQDPLEEFMIRGIRPSYGGYIELCDTVYDGHGGPLVADTLYLCTCDVIIPSGETLTVNSGVTIYFESGYQLIADGTLAVGGESTNPVTLLTQSPPYRGTTLRTDMILQSGAEFKPGD